MGTMLDPPQRVKLMRPTDRPMNGLLVAFFSGSLCLGLGPVGSRAADAPKAGRLADQAALKPYGGLVGGWRRGVGQVERGKVKGAWSEEADWAWKLSPDSAALEGKIARGKYLKSIVVRPGKGPHTYVAEATLADDSTRTFAGKGDERKPLVLTADPPGGPGVRRMTLTLLHDTRLIMLLEAQNPDSKVFYRLGEVGYTREGVSFAVGESGPICIVTEGRGSMTVSYKGKTYHVCCSGCRDLFNVDPEAILAEAAERQKAKDKK
jgi:YHS domain-containing protein